MSAMEKRRCVASVARKMPPRWLFARQPHHLSAPSLKARACAHTVRRTVCVVASLGGSPHGRAACRIPSPCACRCVCRCRVSRCDFADVLLDCIRPPRVGVDAGDVQASAERAACGTGSPFAAAVIFRSRRASAGLSPSIGAIVFSPRDSRILAADNRRIPDRALSFPKRRICKTVGATAI